MVFSGTLRFNLDPFSTYSDAEIWEALSHAHLKAYVEQLEKGLQHDCGEGGEGLRYDSQYNAFVGAWSLYLSHVLQRTGKNTPHTSPVMGLLPDTHICGLRMRLECRERFPRHHGLAIPTCTTARASHARAVMHAGIAN